jgi:threonine dehydrogenase-like Zn-dependent dehydrogenase
MKAIVFDGTLSVKALPAPVLLSGEALLRVIQAGICNTDVEITRGYHRFHGILGHEFVARVEQSPDPRWVGRRVVGEINCVCHRCDLCERGLEKHCRNRTVLGIVNRSGALAEFCTLPLENLHEIPESVSNDEAVFVEPLAAACDILEQITLRPEDRVCLLGDGKLGQLIARVLAPEIRSLTVIGKHEEKLEYLKGLCTQAMTLDEAARDSSLMAGMFDVVVESTGSPGGFRQALSMVRPRGVLVMKSTYHGDLCFDAAPLVVNEIRVIGSRCGPFPVALRKIQQGEVDVKPLIAARFSIEEGMQAFDRAVQNGVLKVLVTMSS